jgi:hypothetical protein
MDEATATTIEASIILIIKERILYTNSEEEEVERMDACLPDPGLSASAPYSSSVSSLTPTTLTQTPKPS